MMFGVVNNGVKYFSEIFKINNKFLICFLVLRKMFLYKVRQKILHFNKVKKKWKFTKFILFFKNENW